MTEEQETMWNVLTNNAEYLSHKWAKELESLKGKKFHRAANDYLGFVVDNFGDEEAARSIKTWLTTYRLPLDPDKLDNFDAFHRKFGHYIATEIRNIRSY
jgi:hypothetical protein